MVSSFLKACPLAVGLIVAALLLQGCENDNLQSGSDKESVPRDESNPAGNLTTPGSSQSGASQPGSSQPGSSQPGSSQPGSSQPGSSQPGKPGKRPPLPGGKTQPGSGMQSGGDRQPGNPPGGGNAPGGSSAPGGGNAPGGSSAPGGGNAPEGGNAPASTSSHAAPMLGDVAKTVVIGTDVRTNKAFAAGENVYGPFEAGFSSQQDFILEGLGCSQGSLGHVAGGIDTQTAEQMVAAQCSITLPRVEEGSYISLLDECGGHTKQYHFHEKMTCLYDATSGAHSTKIAEALDGKLIYGKWEHTENKVLPLLDACGGHFGRTPESPNVDVYHYHVQDTAPFTVGCFGPNDDGSLVTVEQCRSFYEGCDGNLVTVSTPQGSKEYDDWCPCYDANGSNTGKDIAPLAVFASKRLLKEEQHQLRGSTKLP